jgi:hypothetical protein
MRMSAKGAPYVSYHHAAARQGPQVTRYQHIKRSRASPLRMRVGGMPAWYDSSVSGLVSPWPRRIARQVTEHNPDGRTAAA